MNQTSKSIYHNWLHLDFKGMVPSEPRLLEWLRRLKNAGFSALVLEYEDRFPWTTFSCSYRPLFDRAAWDRIWDYCAEIQLEIIPLIQTFGHLEWLLKHEQYRHLRCGDHLNLVCPEHPEVRSLLTAWIQEVAALHPDSPFIHVGLDEVYHLAECPHCQKRAAESKYGKNNVLQRHAAFVCETVLATGKRPILWADMFLSPTGRKVPISLPQEAVLCDWKYIGEIGEDTEYLLKNTRNTVIGASAIRHGHYHLTTFQQSRLDNVSAWHRFASKKQGKVDAILHTVWGRSRGLSPLYGPWEAYLPAFTKAGNPDAKLSLAIQEGMTILERGLRQVEYEGLMNAINLLKAIHSEDMLEEETLRWWELTLRHFAMIFYVTYDSLYSAELQSTIRFQGSDPDLIEPMHEERKNLLKQLEILEIDMRRFLIKNQWSDAEEFLKNKVGVLRHIYQTIQHACGC